MVWVPFCKAVGNVYLISIASVCDWFVYCKTLHIVNVSSRNLHNLCDFNFPLVRYRKLDLWKWWGKIFLRMRNTFMSTEQRC